MRKLSIILATGVTDSLKNLKLALENQGYGILQAKDGQTAIDLYDQAKPDLAILDLS